MSLPDAPIHLTPRLLTLLGYLAEGLNNTAISKRMDLRPKTVENYTVEIYSILFGEDVPHLNRRVAAAGWYWHNNVVRRYVVEVNGELPLLIEIR